MDEASDELLSHLLDVAADLIAPWLVSDPSRYQHLVDEGTVQLGVKLYDIAPRGVAAMDASGDWVTLPTPSATPGLVRSVYGVLGPAMAMGGLSV